MVEQCPYCNDPFERTEILPTRSGHPAHIGCILQYDPQWAALILASKPFLASTGPQLPPASNQSSLGLPRFTNYRILPHGLRRVWPHVREYMQVYIVAIVVAVACIIWGYTIFNKVGNNSNAVYYTRPQEPTKGCR